jgi:hypothetical protein
MSADKVPSAPKTRLEAEQKRLNTSLSRLGNAILNYFFDLTTVAAVRRASFMTLLTSAAAILVVLQAGSVSDWMDALRAFMGGDIGPALNLIGSPYLWVWLPLLVLPYMLAIRMAGIYLADIFEESPSTADQFLQLAAFGGFYNMIVIENGEVTEKSRNSPVYRIGGPGRVKVDLASAALFEKPDGRPHVIGPTVDKAFQVEILDGFERFREAANLRDMFVDPLTMSERSMDGIRVEARDVRLVFSIWRGDKKADLKHPYPFEPEAMEALVYTASSSVAQDAGAPANYSPWYTNMNGLIRTRLTNFIGRSPLSTFLASIGLPEVDTLDQWQQQLRTNGMPPRPDQPEFHPRTEITSLFQDFVEDFTRAEKSNGVQLHWIGVGTWHTPEQIIPQRHLEAWRISRENMIRRGKTALDLTYDEAKMKGIVDLIQEVPLGEYRKIAAAEPVESGLSEKAVQALLNAYRAQLRDSRKKFEGGTVPRGLDALISHIDRSIGHWVGAAAPSSADSEDAVG